MLETRADSLPLCASFDLEHLTQTLLADAAGAMHTLHSPERELITETVSAVVAACRPGALVAADGSNQQTAQHCSSRGRASDEGRHMLTGTSRASGGATESGDEGAEVRSKLTQPRRRAERGKREQRRNET